MFKKNRLLEMFEQMQSEREQFSSMTRDDKVLIVDGTNMFIRTFCAVPILNDDGKHVGGMIGFLKSLGFVIRTMNPTRVVIVFDGKGSSTQRKKMYDGYKQGRVIKSNINRVDGFEGLEDEKRSMMEQMARLVEYLLELPVNVLVIDSVEADDVVAYLALDVFKKDVIILSSDKDFYQIVSDRITIWNPSKKKMYTAQDIIDEYAVSPENFIWYKCLMGDGSDNISKVKGIGAKFISTKLTMLAEREHKSLDSIIEYCQQHESSLRGYKLICDARTTMELNYKVMQLNESSIPIQMRMKVKSIIDSRVCEFNRGRIRLMMISDKVLSAISNMDTWMNSFDNIYGMRDKH